MNELVKTLQTRIKDLEIELARYENARIVCGVEINYWRAKALGVENTHPAALADRAAAKRLMAQVERICPACYSVTPDRTSATRRAAPRPLSAPARASS